MANPQRRRAVEVRFIAAMLALAAIWLAMLLLGRGALDQNIYRSLYAGSRPALVVVARIFTALGEPTVLVGAGFIVAAWLWWRSRARLALALLLVVLIGRGLAEVQKFSIERPRPTLNPHLVVVKTWSFPSGHAASSMIFYLTLALALAPEGQWRRIAAAGAILLSLLIGISRVMLGVHWPSDVVGGWSFGMLWVLLTLRRSEQLLRADSGTGQTLNRNSITSPS
ncbi:MAG TPA: phosphatase PAP2 family protein [Sphingomicrobium sp.]|nr:phosphatase PAP2 family protein [Sphingomicrobium sp.]